MIIVFLLNATYSITLSPSPSYHEKDIEKSCLILKHLVDSLLMGRRVNLDYIMLIHMIACCESTTRVLPYGGFLTKVFREFGLDLST